MGIHMVKRLLLPSVSLLALFSVGFAAWVFSGELSVSVEATTSVKVTSESTTFGTLSVNEGDEFTKESSYYTLVFMEDQTLDESVGIAIYPSIDFLFEGFEAPNDGFSYYLTYRIESSSDSLYAKYVTLEDLSTSVDNGSTLVETSNKQELDIGKATESTSQAGLYDLSGSLTPSLKWRSKTKPTTESAYNDFLGEVEASKSAGETFSVVVSLSYEVTA